GWYCGSVLWIERPDLQRLRIDGHVAGKRRSNPIGTEVQRWSQSPGLSPGQRRVASSGESEKSMQNLYDGYVSTHLGDGTPSLRSLAGAQPYFRQYFGPHL